MQKAKVKALSRELDQIVLFFEAVKQIYLELDTKSDGGAQWLSGRVLDLDSKDR